MPSLPVFLDRLQGFIAKAPAGFLYTIETRNPNYLKPEFTDALRQLGLGFVLTDRYHLP